MQEKKALTTVYHNKLWKIFKEMGIPEHLTCLLRNLILAPQLEKTHETPPSSRDEGLLFLDGLERNPESSIQTAQEA